MKNKKPLTRNCPTCNILITYSSREACRTGERKNSECKSCGTKTQYKNNPEKNIGCNNGRFGKSLLDVMKEKYGNNLGIIKYDEWRINIDSNDKKFKSGVNNPQFGNNSNKKSGLSYKGYYKGLFFRSSFELMFIYEYFKKNNCLPKPADNSKYKVEYELESKKRNYFPDFYCEKENKVLEIKSLKFLNTTQNIIKKECAINHFNKLNIGFESLSEYDLGIYLEYGKSWQKVIYEFMYNLYLNYEIELLDISVIKLKNGLKKKNMISKLNKLIEMGRQTYCIEIDEEGRRHFPNHAQVSYETHKKYLNNSIVSNLILKDMVFHTIKADDVEDFINNNDIKTVLTLLVTALCELHSNASMFGGIESDSFKMKFKQLDRRGKQVLSLIAKQELIN